MTQQYNSYVDSIGALTCKIRVASESAGAAEDGPTLDTKTLYFQARQIDKAVARWLSTKDELERQDLVAQCQSIIRDVTASIKRHPARTAEEQRAVKVYYQAEKYFRTTCGQ